MAPGISFVTLVLVASVAAHVPEVEQGWGDKTGASSSEGDVITCVVGVLCRCGFGRRGPEEICESGFECTPAEPAEPEPAVAGPPRPEPAEVPGGPPKPPLSPPYLPFPAPEAPTGPGPALPGSPHNSGTEEGVKPAAVPLNASNVSGHEVSSAKPELANGTMVHVPGSVEPETPNGMPIIQDNSSALSNASTSPQLRGSAGKATGIEDQPEGPGRRLHSKHQEHHERDEHHESQEHREHKMKCDCGVGCKWGHHMEGKKRICHGPLHCEPCTPRHTGHGSCGAA